MKNQGIVKELDGADADGTPSEYEWTRYPIVADYYRYYKENIHLFQDVHATYDAVMDALQEEIDELSEDEEADTSDLEEDMKRISEWYNGKFLREYGPQCSWDKVKEEYLIEVKKDTDISGEVLRLSINLNYDWMDRLYNTAEETIIQLQKLKDEMHELEARGERWHASIQSLPAGSVQTGMQGEYENKAEVIKEEHVDRTIEILEKGKAYAEEARNELKAIEYMGEKIVGSTRTDWTGLAVGKAAAARGGNAPADNAEVKARMESLHAGGQYREIDEAESNPVFKIKKEAQPGTLYDYISLINSDRKEKDRLYQYLEDNVKRGKVDESAKQKTEQDRDRVKEHTKEEESPPPEVGKIENIMGGTPEAKTGSPEKVDLDKDSSGVADSAVAATRDAVSGFEVIGQILTLGRDKLYLMTYATNMFSCYTTNMDEEGRVEEGREQTLTKIPYTKANNAFYRAEQEYILWGSEDAKSNLNYTKGSIFGIRLLLNMIYAYTSDTQLKSETFTLATAIAGWTGFGVPIVQNALLITAALAESINDTRLLLKGKSLPLYKTPKTWVFRFLNWSKTAEELTKDALNAGSNMLYQEMNRLTAESSEAFQKELDKYTENAVDTLVETSIGAIQTPVQELLLRCSAHLKETHETIESYAAGEVDKCFAGLQEQFEREAAEGSIAASLKLRALSEIKGAIRQDIIDLIVRLSGIESLENGASGISEEVDKLFARKTKIIRNNLKTEARKHTQQLKDDVSRILSEGNERLQEKINDRLNQFTKDIGSSSTPLGGEEFADFDSTTASTFSMNYKEYLMVFLAVRFTAKEGDAISCMGNLIESNAKKADSQYYCGEGFSLVHAYTMIQIDAETRIKPVFLNLPRFNQNNEYFTKDTYPINYKGILGY